MIKSLIKENILKLGYSDDIKMDSILDEAIKETESCFNKTLKQMPPRGEEYSFLIETFSILMKEGKQRVNLSEIINKFCKSDKSFKDFLKETMTVSGTFGSMNGRSALVYDTTRVFYNSGMGYQGFSDAISDDINQSNKDIFNTAIVDGENKKVGIENQEENETSSVPLVGYHIQFKLAGIDEIQKGTIVEMEPAEKMNTDNAVKIKVRITDGKDKDKIVYIDRKDIL
jgi:hypothetical protein